MREHFKQLPDVEEASDEEEEVAGSGLDDEDEGGDEVQFEDASCNIYLSTFIHTHMDLTWI